MCPFSPSVVYTTILQYGWQHHFVYSTTTIVDGVQFCC
uniref:Uncharacterized protein n=1 Tax=Solanum lycopersicum TaxID=4081 RepID=A0A3Q7J8X5_SOLLC